MDFLAHAHDCIARCRRLATYTEEPGFTTRTFLSPPMREVHRDLAEWMRGIGMQVRIDAAGNIRGARGDGPKLLIGSHLDTVPRAGAFDGILGVVMGAKLAETTQFPGGLRGVEIVGFSEEEGVRFGVPFIGSRALIGDLAPVPGGVADAIREFGLNPDEIGGAAFCEQAIGYFEIHIEQGPVLESLGLPLGVVEAIAGQSRFEITFGGRAGHAGTTPMHLRNDALVRAAEWIVAVNDEARAIPNLVATVGRIEALPGASNVIPGMAKLTLDVRHRDDAIRREFAARMIERAGQATAEVRLDQPAVMMDAGLTNALAKAVEKPHRMISGAGHDAMVMARIMPAAMLFVRSPGGISHHPDETVLAEDVAAALEAASKFIGSLA